MYLYFPGSTGIPGTWEYCTCFFVYFFAVCLYVVDTSVFLVVLVFIRVCVVINFVYYRKIIFFLDSRIMSRYFKYVFDFSLWTRYSHICVGGDVILCNFWIVSGIIFDAWRVYFCIVTFCSMIVLVLLNYRRSFIFLALLQLFVFLFLFVCVVLFLSLFDLFSLVYFTFVFPSTSVLYILSVEL